MRKDGVRPNTRRRNREVAMRTREATIVFYAPSKLPRGLSRATLQSDFRIDTLQVTAILLYIRSS